MGCYLHVAICTLVRVKQEHITSKKLMLEELSETLGKKMDLHLYQFSEEDGWFSWYLNKEVLERGLLDYIERQFDLFGLDACCSDPVIEELKERKSWDEILHYSRHSNQNENFCWCNERQYMQIGRYSHVPLEYQYIQFLSDGKIMLESHQCITYLERLIQLQQEQYPLAGATQVWVR